MEEWIEKPIDRQVSGWKEKEHAMFIEEKTNCDIFPWWATIPQGGWISCNYEWNLRNIMVRIKPSREDNTVWYHYPNLKHHKNCKTYSLWTHTNIDKQQNDAKLRLVIASGQGRGIWSEVHFLCCVMDRCLFCLFDFCFVFILFICPS